ncbi:MAG: hypothetical protein IPN11_05970 [Opitutaceae bacterium]|nr:hypothetical protein [Opitutaceae bacterium]
MLVVLAVGLCSDVFAGEGKAYPQISFVLPGKGDSTVSRDQFVILVVEGAFISHEKSPIPSGGVVAYVDNALKAQDATYIGLHIREGVKYGDVVRALDACGRRPLEHRSAWWSCPWVGSPE